MMKPPAAFADLEDVLDLGDGNGIDMRPILLRVLTDLYLQRATHTPEDEHYYTELVLRLIEAADVSDRAALAARLAPHPSAPARVIERLARDVLDVAVPVLKHSPRPAPAHLKAIAEERGSAYTGVIAARSGAASSEEFGLHAADAAELSDLFYAAKSPERRLILINLDYAPVLPSQPLTPLHRTDVWRLESAALQHNTEALVREFRRTLGVSRGQARRMLNDELGEPIVVAAKAMDLSADILQRMLLFLNPWTAQSVDRVYELAELHGEVSMEAARRMITIWRTAEPAGGLVQHETVNWRAGADSARRALSEVLRRPEAEPHRRSRGSEQ
jgi:hypothetical protein